MKTKSTKIIMLALNSLIKSSTNSAKESSFKIFKKFTERVNLIQHKIIESVTKENNTYGTFEDVCANKLDTQNNKCDEILGLTHSQNMK